MPTGTTGRASAAATLPWTGGCETRPGGDYYQRGRAIGLSGSRHPPLPAILVSRLGVDIRWQRRGLGTSLMVHAIGLANDAAPALNAALLLARAESDPGTAFCTRFGFEPFRSRPGWLYRPLRDVEATLSGAAPRPRGASRSR